MKVNAVLRKFQSSPKKTRLVADKIRGMKAEQAVNTLLFINKKSAKPLLKLVKSAIANAENNFKLKKEDLILSEIRVDSDGMLKRIMPRARGMAFPILKRISRVEIVLSDGNEIEIKKVKSEKQKTEAKAEVKTKSIAKKTTKTKEKKVEVKEPASTEVPAEKETNKVIDNK